MERAPETKPKEESTVKGHARKVLTIAPVEASQRDQSKQPESFNTPVEERRAIERELKFGRIERATELETGTSKIFLIELESGEKAVLKAIDLGHEKYEEHGVTLNPSHTERAAYLIDKILGFDLVPPTILRKNLGNNKVLKNLRDEIGDENQFVVQHFVAGETAAESGIWPESLDERILDMAIFDYIISAVDRNPSNYILSGDKIAAIDNELSFEDNGIDLTISDLKDIARKTKISERAIAICRKFNDNQEEVSGLIRKKLEGLLPTDNIEACISRIEQISSLLTRYEEIIPDNEIEQLTYQ